MPAPSNESADDDPDLGVPRPAAVVEPTRILIPPSPATTSIGGSDAVATTVHFATTREDAANEGAFSRLGGFEILGRLGRGGMGVVYRARDLALGRTVAIKVMRAGVHASDEELARFQQEARVIAQLAHPQVVQIHEVGEAEGLVYIVLEFMNGGALSSYLDGQPLAPTLAARIVASLCRGVSAAHRLGVVHRDLKPGNVLVALPDSLAAESPQFDAGVLSAPGVVLKIADFGLAKSTRTDVSRTQTGVMVGTPRYASPEQVEGNPRRISPAADVYSLGAILYELVTGAAVFRATDLMELLDAIRRDEPIAPRTLQPRLDRDLETICLKCLRKEPSSRYATAEELGDDLERWLGHEPIRARPVGALERAAKWVRRHPGGTASAGVGAIALALTAALVVSMTYQAQLKRTNDQLDQARSELKGKNDELSDQNTQLEIAKTAAQTAEAETSRQRDLLARHRYAADMLAAGAAWRVGDIARVESLLERNTPSSAAATDLRGFEWRYLKGLTRKEQARLPGRYAVYSPDASILAIARGGGVDLLDAASRTVLRTAEGPPTTVWQLAFSHDGKRLIGRCQDQPNVRVWNVADGKLAASFDRHEYCGKSVLSPDGGLALSTGSSNDRTAKLWRVDTGEILLDWTTLPLFQYAGDIAFSPDGVWFAVGWPPAQSVRIGKTAKPGDYLELPLPNGSSLRFDGPSQRLLTSREGRVGWFELDQLSAESKFIETMMVGSILDLSSDGSLLATAVAEDKSLRVWDMPSGRLLNSRKGHIGGYSSFSFQGATRYGISSGPDETIRFCDALEPQEHEQAPLRAWGPAAIEFSPDGRTLAIASNMAPIVLYEDGRLRTLESPIPDVWSAGFSPDGRLIAASGHSGVCHWWNVADGKLVHKIVDEKRQPLFDIAFDERGERMAISGSEGRVQIWDLAEKKPLAPHVHGRTDVYHVLFRPGSDEMTTYGDGSILFSGRRSLRGWNTNTNDMQFTPDGSGLYTTSTNGDVLLRDALSGETRTVFAGHQAWVGRIAITADGARIATSSSDGTVKLWDTASGQETFSFTASDPRAIALSRDGRKVAIATLAGDVRIYDATAGFNEQPRASGE